MKGNREKIILNKGKLLEYYRNFNSIEYKYGKYLDKFFEDDDISRIKCVQKLTVHEQARNFAQLTKKNMNSTIMNLKMIYGTREFAEDIAKVYSLVYSKVIGEYINIDGVERLFSDMYANYEWELHLGLDYDSHNMTYYRDHFIHQVKDAFTMDKLLEEGGYLEDIMEMLGAESNSKIAAFVKKYVDIQCEKENYFVKLVNDRGHGSFTEELQKEYFTETIIKMSSYLAALFHDIGYPIVANMKGNENITKYIFETYNLNDYFIDFNKIKALLGNSLLFRVDSVARIKRRLEGNEETGQGIDHGAVSAIVFLLHFYENGAIHRLDPYKICAVELAGLAIYNHTNKYRFLDEKLTDYERSVFVQNPIAHLLRVADDMQEWGRIYFEITDKSNLILCDKCKTPIVKLKKEDKKEIPSYWCHCCKGERQVNFVRAFSEEGFSYRRIYKVTICEEVQIEYKEKGEPQQHIYMCYELNRLLHIAYISPTYAKYRSKEIKNLKKLFLHQDVSYNTYIHTFMSSNIIAIKTEIVGDVLLDEYIKGLENEFVKILKNENSLEFEEVFGEIKTKFDIFEESSADSHEEKEKPFEKLEELSAYADVLKRIEKIKKTDTKDYLKKVLKRYVLLYLWMYVLSIYNTYSLREKKKEGMKALEEWLKGEGRVLETLKLLEDKKASASLKMPEIKLLDNYKQYAKKRYLQVEDYPYYPQDYIDGADNGEDICINVNAFCDREKYREGFPERGFDAYSDLYLFQLIEEIRLEKLEEDNKENSKK